VGISIKNPRTENLIRELAQLTGEGQTSAITKAVEERLERERRHKKKRGRLQRMLAIADRMAPRLKGIDMDEALYGEDGLYDRETGLPK
jgi:antitoxin VapB